MSLSAVKILKIKVTKSSKKEILEEIQKCLFREQGSGYRVHKNLIIFTPNVEQIVLAQKNLEFRDVLNRADVAIPDSIGVVWASKILTPPGLLEPIPGVDFIQDLVRIAYDRHVPIGLIGGTGNVAIGTLECLRKTYPNLIGWDSESTDVVQLALRIKEQKTQMVFVGLGAPKQEFFIEDLARELSTISHLRSTIFMAVGGSFDILSGRLPRAPVFMRTLGLEWLWRLMLEPRRIFRQLAIVEFVWLVIRKRLYQRAK